MKKLKLIYNPNAGDRSFKNKLDECIHVLQHGGFEVHIFRSLKKGDIDAHISSMEKEEYDTVVVSGGDGTINIVINALMKNNITAKLGILPAGTANDFANYLGIPKNPKEACSYIAKGDTISSDIGEVNGRYFINVCGAGLLTNISQNIDENLKNSLGKLAYYLKGLEQVQNFVPIPVKITNSKEVMEENVYLLLVLNGAGAGSFEKLAPNASINDGVFDFIAFKSISMPELAKIFLKVLKGDYLHDPNVIYFQDSFIKIEPNGEGLEKALFETDIDGELGPDMPLTIYNRKRVIEIYYNKELFQ